MTPCTYLATGEIELYFYDDLEPAARAAVRSHLPSCGDCRQTLEELAAIRAALSTRASVDSPPNGDWTPFMTRLADACQPVRLGGGSSVQSATDRQSRLLPPVPPVLVSEIPAGPHHTRARFVSYLAMAALLALVTAGVVYLARWAPRPAISPVTDVTQGTAATSAPIVPPSERSADAAFAALSEQHFERSKLVVLGLANKDPRHAGEGDWAYERELATNLLSDTRLYRQAAEARGLRTLAGVMGDLEIVLLQTSLADVPDAEALGQIQRLIHKRDLVTKMDVSGAGS
jgi:hypothetical protein